MPAEYCRQICITFVSAIGVMRVLQAGGVRASCMSVAVCTGPKGSNCVWEGGRRGSGKGGRRGRERERDSEEATKREGREWRDGGRMVARGFAEQEGAQAKAAAPVAA